MNMGETKLSVSQCAEDVHDRNTWLKEVFFYPCCFFILLLNVVLVKETKLDTRGEAVHS